MTSFLIGRRRLLALLGLAPAAAAAPLSPGRPPVRLLFTRINGERYYDAATSLPTLAEGDTVALRREPTNPHDRRAIEVLDAAGRKLGYIARIDNSALARMIDAGERFRAQVARVDRPTRDIRLTIDWLPG